LSYLRHFPLQALKIDRSFVAELGDAGHSSHAVVRAILALAGSLDLQAIAEGIETRIQRERLVALGCRFGQGYLLGRPQPVDAWRASAADA
jgi:EAL domain-containing protein (putative c-di-GMP-specific phosphodiesterase class I)